MGVYTTVGLPWLLFLYPSFVSLRLEEEEEVVLVDEEEEEERGEANAQLW